MLKIKICKIICKSNKKLTSISIRTCISHRNNACLIMPYTFSKFIRKYITRTSSTSTSRITCLNNKPINNPMKNKIIKIRLICNRIFNKTFTKTNKIHHGQRSNFIIKFNFYSTFICIN